MEMEGTENGMINNEKIQKEVPQLIGVLKEMKGGLDLVTNKVQELTAKVKEKQFPTAEGISYLEAKHLLLISYCQSLVYYLLRKAKGLPIEGHPVVRSLVEIRFFLEKIRPIDKKCGYRIERLLAAAKTDAVKANETEKAGKMSEDLLTYKPNPGMLVTGDTRRDDEDGIYKPPKFTPTVMGDDRKKTKQERDAERKEKDSIRRAAHSESGKRWIDSIEGRPEEVRDIGLSESKDLSTFVDQWEKRQQQEEETFNRAPITKAEKKKIKQLRRSNGLSGLADSFFDEIKGLPLGDDDADAPKARRFGGSSSMGGKHKRRKVKY